MWTLCNMWHVCWIVYDLGCMWIVYRDMSWYSMNYRVYMGSSMIVRPLVGCHCTCALINWLVLWHKRPPLDKWSKYLYPLIQNITFGGWVITLRGDWTLRSVIPATVSEKAVKYWPDSDLCPISTDRTRPVTKNCSLEPYWCWPDDGTQSPVTLLFSVRSVTGTWLTSGQPSLERYWSWPDSSTQRPITFHSTSGRIQTTSAWSNELTKLYCQCSVTPGPASGQYLTLHSLPTQNHMWMKFAPIDLRATSELPSGRFNKCAPHLTY